MQDNNYILNSNNHIMDRNLYQQCNGAHVFSKNATFNWHFRCVSMLCVRVPVRMAITHLRVYAYTCVLHEGVNRFAYIVSLLREYMRVGMYALTCINNDK